MSQCIEFAVFRVAVENVSRALALSEAIFSEMNSDEEVILSYQILRKINVPEVICWHITWVSAEAATNTTEKWPTFPSTKAFQDIVVEDLYYGHFVDAH